MFQLTKNSVLTPIIYAQSDTDGLSISFEDDGTMVYKTTKDFTLLNGWEMPLIRTKIDSPILKGTRLRVSFDYAERGDGVYLVTDAYYGRPGIVSTSYTLGIPTSVAKSMPSTAVIENYSYEFVVNDKPNTGSYLYMSVQGGRAADMNNLTIPADTVLFKLRNLKVEWLPDIPS